MLYSIMGSERTPSVEFRQLSIKLVFGFLLLSINIFCTFFIRTKITSLANAGVKLLLLLEARWGFFFLPSYFFLNLTFVLNKNKRLILTPGSKKWYKNGTKKLFPQKISWKGQKKPEAHLCGTLKSFLADFT